MTFRYLAWKVSQCGGPFWRWLITGWRVLLLLFIVTYAVVNIPVVYNKFLAEKQNTSASSGEAKPSTASPVTIYNNLVSYSSSPSASHEAARSLTQPPTLLQLAALALGIDTLWLLMVAANKTRNRIFIDEFADYTTKATNTKEVDPRVRAITTLLADQLTRSSDLYRKVDQQTAVFARGVDIPVRDANIRTESINDLLKDAVSADTKLRVGFLDIPIGTFMKLLGQLARGPRITGGFYKEGEQCILTAQMTGGRRPYSWRVEDTIPLEPARAGAESNNLDVMVAELACRIFTDIALDSSVRWRATRCFNEGLRAYRNCLRTPKDRRNGLRKAERAFMETLADDEKFEWAYYNLGLVYTGLGQMEAAAAAFQKSIDQDRSRWEPYYALAQVYFENDEEENHVFVVGLCERITILQPAAAKGYRLLCQAQYKEAQRRYTNNGTVNSDLTSLLEKAQKSGEQAVANSWKNLCREYWHKRTADPEEERITQHIKVARDCLCDLATVYMLRADAGRCQKKTNAGDPYTGKLYRTAGKMYHYAELAYRQADLLCPSDPDVHLNLGRLYLRQGNYKCAIYEFRYALRMDTTRADLWAYLWLTSDLWRSMRKHPNFQLEVLAIEQSHCASSKKELGLLPDEKMGETARKEFYDRACDALPDALKAVIQDFELLKTLVVPGACSCPTMQSGLNMLNMIQQRNEVEAVIRKKLKCGHDTAATLETLWDKEWEKEKQKRKEEEPFADPWILGRIHLTEWRLKNDAGEKTTDSCPVKRAISLKRLVLKQESKKDRQEEIENAWEYAQLSLLLGQLCLEAVCDPTHCSLFKGAAHDYFQEAISVLEKNNLTSQIRKQSLQAELAEALLLVKDNVKQNRWRALEHAGVAAELDPMSAYERSILGKTFAMLNQMEQASSAYEFAQLWTPDDPALWLEAGKVHLNVARDHRVIELRRIALNKAILLLEGALERYGNGQIMRKGHAHYTLGQVHMELNEYAKAVCHFRSAEASCYAPMSTLFSKGWALLRSQQFEEAIDTFNEVICQAGEDYRSISDKEQESKEVNYWNIIDERQDTDRKRPVGLVRVYAYLSKAFALLDQDIVSPECDYLVQGAEYIIEKMKPVKPEIKEIPASIKTNPAPEKPSVRPQNAEEIDTKASAMGGMCENERQKCLRLCQQMLADCRGWLALKQGGFDGIEEAITCFKEAISYCADSGAYYHLALAYEIKLWKMQENTPGYERKYLLQHAHAQGENARRCDLSGEYKDRLDALEDRLIALEKSPGATTQANSVPETPIAILSLKALSPPSTPALPPTPTP